MYTFTSKKNVKSIALQSYKNTIPPNCPFSWDKKDFCSSYYVGMYEESEDCKIVLLHYLITFMKIIETNNKYIGKLLHVRLKQVEK